MITVHRPVSAGELFTLIGSEPGPHFFLAGGTDLLVQHKDGVVPTPSTWFDLTAIGDFAGIREVDGQVVIGATTTHDDLVRSALIRKYAPVLVQGCEVIGGPQIRNRGTVGGNLANGSPAADTAPPLYSLEAEVELTAASGSRWLPIADFFLHVRKTALQPGEVITAVRFPARPETRGGFQRLGQRRSQAISKVSVAVTRAGDYLAIACGSVAPTVIRARRAEEVLRGGGSLDEACRLIQEEVKPITDVRSTADYRRAMAGVLLRRVMESLG